MTRWVLGYYERIRQCARSRPILLIIPLPYGLFTGYVQLFRTLGFQVVAIPFLV